MQNLALSNSQLVMTTDGKTSSNITVLDKLIAENNILYVKPTRPLNEMSVGDIPLITAKNGTNNTQAVSYTHLDGKEIKGHLQFAINSRIKLIYRPARIGEPYDITKKLYVHKFNDLVTIKNPTPFFVTLVNISIDGKTIHRDIDEVIKPYSEINIDARNPKWIEFSTVNDKGGTTPPIKINL